jgi:hypothetical protein
MSVAIKSPVALVNEHRVASQKGGGDVAIGKQHAKVTGLCVIVVVHRWMCRDALLCLFGPSSRCQHNVS